MSRSASPGLWKATAGQSSQTLRILKDLGITRDDLQRLQRDRPFAERLVAFWKAAALTDNPYPDTESQSRARAIMGKNFLGLDEVRRGYNVTYTAEQCQQLAAIPFSKETLRVCNDTHVLVAGAPLSLNEVRMHAHEDFFDTDWYGFEPFANDQKVSVRWYLLRKQPAPESCSKTYEQQTDLLTREEEVPLACEVAFAVILYYLTHGERLLQGDYVRCCDRESEDGNRVVVGYFCSFGFAVRGDWDDGRRGCLGLLSSRRS